MPNNKINLNEIYKKARMLRMEPEPKRDDLIDLARKFKLSEFGCIYANHSPEALIELPSFRAYARHFG